jgi:hypothetical protein
MDSGFALGAPRNDASRVPGAMRREVPLRRTGTPVASWAPALQRTTPRRGGALRCVRGTKEFSFINIKSGGFLSPGLKRPLSCSRPVHEGALHEAFLKWDRIAAPAAMPRKHGLGGPWVTVRAHYGALPSVAGRGRRRAGESPPGWRAKARACAGRTVPGSRKSPRRSAARRCRVLLFPGDPGNKPRLVDYAPFGAPSPLISRRENRRAPTRAAARECGRLGV